MTILIPIWFFFLLNHFSFPKNDDWDEANENVVAWSWGSFDFEKKSNLWISLVVDCSVEAFCFWNPDYPNKEGFCPNGDLSKGLVFESKYFCPNNGSSGLFDVSGFPNNEAFPKVGNFGAGCPNTRACGLFDTSGYPKGGASCLLDVTGYSNKEVCYLFDTGGYPNRETSCLFDKAGYPKTEVCGLIDAGGYPNKETSVFFSVADWPKMPTVKSTVA